MNKQLNTFEKRLFDRINELCSPVLSDFFVYGELDDRDQKRVGIIGSRRMTSYGKQITSDICKFLALNQVTVVSGLMYGVDLEAQKSILEFGGRTIGVLGYGVNHLKKYSYAAEVAEKIVGQSQGAVISEFKPEQGAQVWTFPRRNRIVAALSDYLIIVEAAKNSGTTITADLALEMGKDVYVVPGSIYSDQSYGCNKLLSQGAIPLYDLSQLELKLTEGRERAADFSSSYRKIPDLDEDAAKIYAYMVEVYRSEKHKSVDKFELMKNTLDSVNAFNVGLSELELNNLIAIEGDIITLK
jgi:DNA protecting protein DprA